jgi:hypothetical protein
MRQRYLLGRYNSKKYGSKLLTNNSGLYVQSTDVNRTIQSIYSELSGLLYK